MIGEYWVAQIRDLEEWNHIEENRVLDQLEKHARWEKLKKIMGSQSYGRNFMEADLEAPIDEGGREEYNVFHCKANLMRRSNYIIKIKKGSHVFEDLKVVKEGIASSFLGFKQWVCLGLHWE